LILGHGSVSPDGALPENSQNVAHVQEAMVIGKPKQSAEWRVDYSMHLATLRRNYDNDTDGWV